MSCYFPLPAPKIYSCPARARCSHSVGGVLERRASYTRSFVDLDLISTTKTLQKKGSVSASSCSKLPVETGLCFWAVSDFSSTPCRAGICSSCLGLGCWAGCVPAAWQDLAHPHCLLLLKAKPYLSRGLETTLCELKACLSLENNSSDIGMLLLSFSLILGSSEPSLFEEWMCSNPPC